LLAASWSTWASTFSLNGLHRVFLDTEQRKIRAGSDGLNASSCIDADDDRFREFPHVLNLTD
jgi:hypothetical protein